MSEREPEGEELTPDYEGEPRKTKRKGRPAEAEDSKETPEDEV
jgi:hypothetical protein